MSARVGRSVAVESRRPVAAVGVDDDNTQGSDEYDDSPVGR